MSRFFSEKYQNLTPYTPGEQPQDMEYIKLNTNESPFDVPEEVVKAVEAEARKLRLYSDPDCRELVEALAARYEVKPSQVVVNNGSDETLNFAFMAFCDAHCGAAFPNISYGFYPVFAQINNLPYEEIPLKEDLTIDIEDYKGLHKTIFIANPNAPTGIALSRARIEEIVAANPDNVVVVDEAYVDFGGESSIPLISKYDNLLVVRTFSKSRSMAGARLGFGIGNEALIQDLNTIRYSTNPYNLNRMTLAAGVAYLKHDEIMTRNCTCIQEVRAWTMGELAGLGFEMTDSRSNFIFARSGRIDGGELYRQLKARGILVRHFDKPLISSYVRITVGSREQMQALLEAIREILSQSEKTPTSIGGKQ